MKYNTREFIEELIGSDAESFAKWAVGDLGLPFKDWPDRWNEIHGDKFKIHKDSYIAYDVPEMIKLWRKEIQ
jgi:hypothetical protein